MPAAVVLTRDQQAAQLVGQLHALAVAMNQAKARKDLADLKNLLAAFKRLADQYRALGAGDMSALDRFILATGTYLGQSASAGAGIVRDTAALVGNVSGDVLKPTANVLIDLLKPLAPWLIGGLAAWWFITKKSVPGRRREW